MRSDFEKYLLKVQEDSIKMNKCIEEANQLAKEGKLPQENADFIANQINIVNNNLQRLMYCKYLLDLPPKFIQKLKEKKLRDQLEKFQKSKADDESVEVENTEAINAVRDVLTSEGN